MNRNLKIEIRRIPLTKEVQDFSKDLGFFSRPHIVSPKVDSESLQYDSGLTEEDIKYLKEKGFPYDVEDTQYIPKTPHKFWESSLVKVELLSTPMFLYPGRNLMDFVKWKYLLKSPFVYSSEAEMLGGTKPEATHYIFDEGEENKIKASKIERRNELIQIMRKQTLERKRQIILILLNENTENKDDNYITLRIEDIIKDKILSTLLEKLLSEESDESIAIKALVKDAIQKNILRRTSKGIFYFETNLGFGEDEVISFLSKQENQKLYISILEKIKNK